MTSKLIAGVLLTLCLVLSVHAMTVEERQAYREKLLQIIPEVQEFNAWLAKTDELPPDFDALPRNNSLPDAFRFLDGRNVTTSGDWNARRAEIRKLFEQYVFGTIPPRPAIHHADMQETREQGYRARKVTLHLGPNGEVDYPFDIILPEGTGPFPVLMTPSRSDISTLIRRGYAGVGYPGNDFDDRTTAVLEALYPGSDMALLPARAWCAGIVLDYLETVPEVDMDAIGIYGYSRDGKQAAITGAIDERIDVVLAGSTGVGGTLPYRLAGERNQAESIESTTRMFPSWFHPRLRFFSGRVDRLPVDGNLLVALIAPRACLIHYNRNDEVGNTFGNEAAWRDARRVYAWLGAPEKVGILRQKGFHSSGMDLGKGLDFMDIALGRSSATWHNDELFPWNFEAWRAHSGESINSMDFPEQNPADLLTSDGGRIATPAQWDAKAEVIRERVRFMLGEAPPQVSVPRSPGFGGFRNGGKPSGPIELLPGVRALEPARVEPDVPGWVINRNSAEFGWRDPERSFVQAHPLTFGYGNVQGMLYAPKDAPKDARLPTVIWLHSYSYPIGYMWVYRRDLHPVLALAQQGYAVLAFDQSGFGERMDETKPFYDRWPHWSRMGRLVEDVSEAVTALQQDPQVDPDRIYVFGYSMGGMVGLHAAALDARIKGVVSIAGFTPMRTDTVDTGTGGIARFSHERGLIPRLGFFVGNETRIPYDYDELIAAIAPRPVMIVAPQLDRDANPADVRTAVERVRPVYELHGAGGALELREPWDYTRLPASTQDALIAWMKAMLK
jgi:pimeloyl-ACP methyl ester carboxylesterase